VIANDAIIGIAGAGAMGAGIAQVAAAAGHPVLLFDSASGGAVKGIGNIERGLDGLVAKGKMAKPDRDALITRIRIADSLNDFSACAVVIEAISEDLTAKRELFARLESVVAEDALLATNTSSISVTAIACYLKRPAQFAGMHFFNPAPVMKLVEIVSGLATAKAAADALFELATRWGKTAVHARSTPGFIVNRIARPYYAEALMLLHEKRAKPAAIDACMRAAGFRMGPCELMDFIGHDVNFAVTQSVFAANFFDRRYAPSLVQQELVDAGRLGRKTGQGFYVYNENLERKPSRPPAEWPPYRGAVAVMGGASSMAGVLEQAFAMAGAQVKRIPSLQTGLKFPEFEMLLTDGRTAAERAIETGNPNVAVFDIPVAAKPAGALAVAFASSCAHAARQDALSALAGAGWMPLQVADTPGLIVARTVAMLINEAADAVQQGVCTPEGADAAMKLGVNWPAGPFEMLNALGADTVTQILDALQRQYQSERYRISPWLLERVLSAN
jgi:3-hydroxybutyryl-CoA dehydrogenase